MRRSASCAASGAGWPRCAALQHPVKLARKAEAQRQQQGFAAARSAPAPGPFQPIAKAQHHQRADAEADQPGQNPRRAPRSASAARSATSNPAARRPRAVRAGLFAQGARVACASTSAGTQHLPAGIGPDRQQDQPEPGREDLASRIEMISVGNTRSCLLSWRDADLRTGAKQGKAESHVCQSHLAPSPRPACAVCAARPRCAPWSLESTNAERREPDPGPSS